MSTFNTREVRVKMTPTEYHNLQSEATRHSRAMTNYIKWRLRDILNPIANTTPPPTATNITPTGYTVNAH